MIPPDVRFCEEIQTFMRNASPPIYTPPTGWLLSRTNSDIHYLKPDQAEVTRDTAYHH